MSFFKTSRRIAALIFGNRAAAQQVPGRQHAPKPALLGAVRGEEHGRHAPPLLPAFGLEGLAGLGQQRVLRQERTNRLEARKDVLGLKQALVSAAYDKAREAILALEEDKYVAFLAAQAGAAALTGSEEVVLGKGDRERLGARIVEAANAAAAKRGVNGAMKLSDDVLPADGGLVLRRGSIEVNCTLDKLLEMSHSSLDADVASVLFN